MAKISVRDAAKQLDVEIGEMIKTLRELGVSADTPTAEFDEEVLAYAKNLVHKGEKKTEGQQNVEERRIGTTVIRRRARSRAKTVEAAPEPSPAETTADDNVEEAEVAASAEETSADEPMEETQIIDKADLVEAPAAEAAEEAATAEAAESGSPAAEASADGDVEGLEPEPEPERNGRRARVVNLRGVTPEPAKVISRPSKPVAPQRPVVPGPPPDSDDSRSRGRRVVEIGSGSSYTSRRKTKEAHQREMRAQLSRKKKSKNLKTTEITVPKASKRKIKIEAAVKVGDLAHRMGIKSGELMKKLFEMGQMVTINTYLDVDSASIIASEYGYEIEDTAVAVEEMFESAPDAAEDLVERHPVVTVMGHVDHGKTSLLDAIRKTKVAAGEAGGITQHIGAYKVSVGDKAVAFVDTPGHHSFTAMRARGAQVTDVVVLVVAADDGVMPQTVEAINHARDAKVPIVVAINKIDKEGANVDRIYAELAERGLSPEEWGGETQYAKVSAKTGQGIDDLLDKILLQAEVLELKANPNKPAAGVVLEAYLEKGRGPVATVLVQEGTLRVGDSLVAGAHSGRVRFMHDDKWQRVEEALPGDPVEVIGLSGVPAAGDKFIVAENEKAAKSMAEVMEGKAREARNRRMTKVNLENLFDHIKEGETKELKIILKGDVQGSIEAVIEALDKLATELVKVNVVHSGVGGITEYDINFAIASEAIVIGFNVRPAPDIRDLAQREGVEIRTYSVIYELIDDITLGMEGMLEPIRKEVYLGRAEIREIFNISRIGTIAGCYVTDGKIQRNANVRLLRDDVEVHSGKLASLKRFKDDAKEVPRGMECGMQIENYNDVKPGDIIEAFTYEAVARKLADVRAKEEAAEKAEAADTAPQADA